jgi:hypothetical protein
MLAFLHLLAIFIADRFKPRRQGSESAAAQRAWQTIVDGVTAARDSITSLWNAGVERLVG